MGLYDKFELDSRNAFKRARQVRGKKDLRLKNKGCTNSTAAALNKTLKKQPKGKRNGK